MIAIFDLDHTLINANSSYCFGVFLYRQGVLTLPQAIALAAPYALHKAGGMTLASLHRCIFSSLFKAKPRHPFAALAERFLNTHFEQLLRPEVVQRLRDHQASGDTVALYSSSPDFLVSPIAERLNIQEVLSSQYNVDKEGFFDKIPVLVTGEEKKRAFCRMQRERPGAQAAAYSDSLEDLPLLEAVNRPVCVFPDRRLKKIAISKQWEVIEHGCQI